MNQTDKPNDQNEQNPFIAEQSQLEEISAQLENQPETLHQQLDRVHRDYLTSPPSDASGHWLTQNARIQDQRQRKLIEPEKEK